MFQGKRASAGEVTLSILRSGKHPNGLNIIRSVHMSEKREVEESVPEGLV